MRPIKRLIYGVLASSLVLTTTSCGDFMDVFLPMVENNGESPDSPVSDSEAFQAPMSEVVLQKSNDQSGQRDEANDMQIISAEYQVRLKNPELGNTANIKIPLSQPPEDLDNAQIQVERYDENTGQWQAAGNFSWYDAGSKSVWFRDQLPIEVTPTSDFNTEQVTSKTATYRIRIYIFSNDQTAYREGSQFRIHYYPSNLENKNKIKSDSEWSSPNGSQESNVPDFVEDLDTALNEAYQAMLNLSHSEGKVFKPLAIQDVYISDTGGNAGDSKLGGPLRISNRNISSYQDLKLTAAHELTHVFQGQYYTLKGLFTGRQNHWFIEAVANYYAARVNGLDDTAKKAFYAEFYSDYLSVSLTSNTDNSMYAAGHFLDWLSQKYGLNVVGDALRLSIGNDMVGLSQAIRAANNGASSIGGAFEDYLEEILTQPEDQAGFNLDIRNTMAQHSFGYGYLSTPLLNESRNYARVRKDLPPLSSSMISLNLDKYKNTSNRYLFVMTNNKNQGSLLKGQAYLMESDLNKDYLNARPIDKYLSYSRFKEFHAFTNFDTFSQLMINNSPATKANIDMSYYVLKPPAWEKVSEDQYSISIKKTIGNIPIEYLSGFKVYTSEGKFIKGPVPIQSKSEYQDFSFQIGVKPSIYTIVDKVGNEWPYHIVLTGNATGKAGETIKLEVKLIGFEDADLKWTAQNSPSSLSQSGATAFYRTSASRDTFDTVTVTSSKYPHLSATTSIWSTKDVDACISAGTLVTLADGSRKAIETLKAGDAIQAWDEDSNQVVKAQIKRLLIHQDAPYTLNRVQGSDGDEIQITGNHPVYTKESGWIPVDQLKAGMTLYQMDHVTQRFVETVVKGIIREESKANVVYNLLTSEGNYFANDLLIHNKCLATGSLIDTPTGQVAVEALIPGSLVYDRNGHITEVQSVYRKETVLADLPGKRLPEGAEVTHNHSIFWQGQWQKAGQTDLPSVRIVGAVYDLKTQQGSYRSGTTVMGK